MNGHFPLGERTGFIKHHVLHAVQRFQRFAVAEQHAVQRANARAHHDGDRGCQPQRAGAGDDQHRDRAAQREGKLFAPAAARCRNVSAAMPMTMGTNTPLI